jgi:hypothetical protein
MTEYEDKPAKRRQDICATAKPPRNSRLYRSEWGWQRGQEKRPVVGYFENHPTGFGIQRARMPGRRADISCV